jgi:hypothetical protein
MFYKKIKMNNTTTFIRKKKNTNYSIVDNSIIHSKDLTIEESFLLIYLLSLPDTWSLYKTNIEKEFKLKKLSKSRFNKSWKGLKEKGFIEGSKVKGAGGKFHSWKYRVIEDPFSDLPKTDMSGNQHIGKPMTHNKVDILIPNKKNTNRINTNENNNKIYNILGELSDRNKNIIINNRTFIKNRFPKYPELLSVTSPEEMKSIQSKIPTPIWNKVADRLMQIGIAAGN